MATHTELANFIWSVADLLRGDYKQSEYGKVILPFTVLRRLDCVMTPKTREKVWAADAKYRVRDKDSLLRDAAGLRFYNTSRQSFATIGADADNVRKNLVDYLNGFSPSAREIIEKYDFHVQIERLDTAGLLYLVVQRFAGIDLSLKRVDNHQMGYVFEELIRKFSEISNETAGEHFTPREVIKLMVNLLIAPDAERLTDPEVINILDPACGTGGMLSAAEEHIASLNPSAKVFLFGQELNAESYAICRSDMMIKGQDPSRIKFGNSFSDDQHSGQQFDYLLANPPFGVEWKKVQKPVEDEHRSLGYAGRFGAGLPRINDGSFLFLQHMLAKMRPIEKGGKGGTRLAIVFNGSPLFTGGAGSGESEIRRWIFENDWLEAIIGLPDQLFYNTGISTYFWILTNRKDPAHEGKVILLDARDQWAKMRRSLGDKRKYATDDQIRFISDVYADALNIAADPDHEHHDKVKVFRNEDFGYQRITVDRPLKLKFEISDAALSAIRGAEIPWVDQFADALKPLLGTVCWTMAEAKDKVHAVLAEAGLEMQSKAVSDAIWSAISVTDPNGEVQVKKGTPLPDPDLRDFENVPLVEGIDEYFAREVLPHVPDAWIADAKDPKTKQTIRAKIGYEIAFTRHFYVYTPPRSLAVIDAELRELEVQIQRLLSEVTA